MAWLLLSTQTQETLVSRIIPEGFIERMNMQVKHFRCFIAWRHAYENEGGVIDAVVRSKWGLVTVSRGGRLLRSWDVSSGVLRWESLTGLSSKAEQLEYPLNADWRPGGVVATLAGTSIGKSCDFSRPPHWSECSVMYCYRYCGGCHGK